MTTLLCDTDKDEDAHNTLDKGELKFAMGLLWEKLDDMAGGTRKLPRIAESSEEVLYQFDEDADGRLEMDEFRQDQCSHCQPGPVSSTSDCLLIVHRCTHRH